MQPPCRLPFLGCGAREATIGARRCESGGIGWLQVATTRRGRRIYCVLITDHNALAPRVS
eukprot:5099853-Pleurochrysis_carterae.AAC.4